MFFLLPGVSQGGDVAYLPDAEYVDIESETPPDDFAGWQEVGLPHFTDTANPNPRSGWYRIPLTPVALSSEAYGVYLWRYSMNAQVWLNDTLIGGSGRFEAPITRNWNRPMLFLVPKSAWKPADNTLYIRLASYPGWGYLAPPLIGPMKILEPEYEMRFFWQISSNQLAAMISFVAALVAFSLWFVDRSSSIYAIFGVLCIAWTIWSGSNFLQHSPVSARMWWWSVHVSVDIYAVSMALFARRLAGYGFDKTELWLGAYVVLAMIFFAVIPLHRIPEWNPIFHIVALLISFGVLIFALIQSFKYKQMEMRVFTLCVLLVCIFAIHDHAMQTRSILEIWRSQFFWLQFGAPILTIAMLVILARRFALTLQLQLDAEQQIRMERERIFTDIHDDVGSRLLSLIYAAESESQAELAREALRETRAIVNGAVSHGSDLEATLQNVQAETQQRCEEAGVKLQWVQQDIYAAKVSDSFHYHLQRIIRELVTNSLKHARSNQLEVFLRIAQNKLILVVRDEGDTPSDFEPGTGMSGIQRRSAELHGTASWDFSGPGCRVEVTLPLSLVPTQVRS